MWIRMPVKGVQVLPFPDSGAGKEGLDKSTAFVAFWDEAGGHRQLAQTRDLPCVRLYSGSSVRHMPAMDVFCSPE